MHNTPGRQERFLLADKREFSILKGKFEAIEYGTRKPGQRFPHDVSDIAFVGGEGKSFCQSVDLKILIIYERYDRVHIGVVCYDHEGNGVWNYEFKGVMYGDCRQVIQLDGTSFAIVEDSSILAANCTTGHIEEVLDLHAKTWITTGYCTYRTWSGCEGELYFSLFVHDTFRIFLVTIAEQDGQDHLELVEVFQFKYSGIYKPSDAFPLGTRVFIDSAISYRTHVRLHEGQMAARSIPLRKGSLKSNQTDDELSKYVIENSSVAQNERSFILQSFDLPNGCDDYWICAGVGSYILMIHRDNPTEFMVCQAMERSDNGDNCRLNKVAHMTLPNELNFMGWASLQSRFCGRVTSSKNIFSSIDNPVAQIGPFLVRNDDGGYSIYSYVWP